jgi:hypothetical protein
VSKQSDPRCRVAGIETLRSLGSNDPFHAEASFSFQDRAQDNCDQPLALARSEEFWEAAKNEPMMVVSIMIWPCASSMMPVAKDRSLLENGTF